MTSSLGIEEGHRCSNAMFHASSQPSQRERKLRCRARELSRSFGAGDGSHTRENHPPLWTPARVEILGIRPYLERLIA